MKITFVCFLAGCAITAEACLFDLPSDDVHVCKNKILQKAIGFPAGGLACCEGYGSISVSVQYSAGKFYKYSCKCSTDKEPSTVNILGNGKREQDVPRAATTTPPGPHPIVDYAGLPQFRQEALTHHNSLRAVHSTPPLRLSDDLNKYAQHYAEQLAWINQNLVHSERLLNGEILGENIAWFSTDPNGERPVQAWYDEVTDYDPIHPLRPFPVTGHFTQVVWKSTTELGMGKATTADGSRTFVVGSYRKAGNMRDDNDREKTLMYYQNNVLPQY